MKKITILIPHLGIGGTTKYITGLANFLSEEYLVDLVSVFKVSESPLYLINSNVSINYLIEDYVNMDNIKRYFKRKNIFKCLGEVFKLVKLNVLRKVKTRKFIKTLSSDYILTSDLYDTKMVNKLLKRKNTVKIYTEHNEPESDYFKRIIKYTKNYDKLVLPNQEITLKYKKEIGIKAICIPNFIDKSPLGREKVSNKLISVGKLSKEKDFLSLIDIVSMITKEIPEVKLTLIGDGKEKTKIKRRIKELKLEDNVILTGYKNALEIEEEMLNSNVFVSTSISESFGISILEAMNVGLPVVSFDTSSGARDLLKGGTGILVENRDKEVFCTEVISLLKSNFKMSEYSKKSLLKVEEYRIDIVKKEWFKLFKELSNRSLKKVMFISSTGGHLNEMLMLKSMFNKYPFMLVTENTFTNKWLKDEYGRKFTKYLVYGTRKHILSYPFKLFYNTIKSFYLFCKFRPDFILSTGAHTAGPMCVIGHLFRKKIIFIESFANSETPSVTGKIVYKFADLFIVQWKGMLKVYDKATYGGWIY